MDLKSVKCAINSISRFIHLVSCQTNKSIPTMKNYRIIASVLKILKPLLDEIIDEKLPCDKFVCKECEVLDLAVNQARELLENWSMKMSQLFCVLESDLSLIKIHGSSFQIYCIISRSLSELPSSESPAIQNFMEELKGLKLEGITTSLEEALKGLRRGDFPSNEVLTHIIELFSMTSCEELLRESLALEKERIKVLDDKVKGDLDRINSIIDLMSHIRDFLLEHDNFKFLNGIRVPSYFRCPLSLELMLDPVIVSSGQTYERSSIQNWLTSGFSTCPRTRQTLSHTNLIPNYTVKALIANWCDENNLNFNNPQSVKNGVCSLDLVRLDSFQSTQSNDSISRSSVGNNGFNNQHAETDRSGHSSPGQRYVHTRNESASSVVSSVLSGEMTLDSSISYPTKSQDSNPRNLMASSVSVLSCDDSITSSSHVEKLVEDLKSQSNEAQASAAAELRSLSKHSTENRTVISSCGAIVPLLSLLYSDVKNTQEHAVTAILNLSINENVKTMIAEAGAIEPLIHVLRTGNAGARENTAAALFSISVLEEYRIKIGRSNAVKALVDLLQSGTLRGKKDATTALFNLSITHENKARIVQAGAVKYLVQLMDPGSGMVDKAVALLANLSTVVEGCTAIVRAGGIPYLVEIVETGSNRGKENAASVLFQLCINNVKFCRLILQEGAVPPLVALSQSGSPRAREKAQQLLSHFRSQREGGSGKGKS
ncbi:U-box domain-containing protein 3 [Impatiens glandulifera]|uniref:U-box domain-containing protein 3 n=1 Tax=Impatiens glandulifera TaxID=253017 RepID=UPI001FB10750|nr:U-box domain-containing protein 3 [Impatiens glandulifera]